MKQIKSLTALTLLGVVLGFGPAAYASDDCKPGHGFRHMEHRLLDKLELTDEQKAQVKSLHEEKKAQRGEHRVMLREAHREMHELVNAGTLDEAAIRAKALELAEVHADHAIEHARFMQRLRAILTPAQLEKFEALKAEHGGGVKKGFRPHTH